jgi:hypothetical protein
LVAITVKNWTLASGVTVAIKTFIYQLGIPLFGDAAGNVLLAYSVDGR